MNYVAPENPNLHYIVSFIVILILEADSDAKEVKKPHELG